MKCQKCGAINIANSAFCSNCGQKFPQKNRKIFLIVGIALLAIIIAIVLVVVIKKAKPVIPPDVKRTIMVYMVGSNLESSYGAGSSDLTEMINAELNLEDSNLVVYTGGSKVWYSEDLTSDNNTILELTADGLNPVLQDDAKNMGEAATLTYFLDYAYKNYKSDKYSLVLWDHGGGPIYGFGNDELNNFDSLSLVELSQALKDSPFNKKNKLEMVGFDACLMASAEVAHIFSDYADYMVASQEVEPGAGWDYSFLGIINGETTSEAIGQEIVDDYYNFYAKSSNGNMVGKNITLSFLDLTALKNLEESLNTLFTGLEVELINSGYEPMAKIRAKSSTFGITSTARQLDLVDIYNVAKVLEDVQGTNAKTLMDAVDKVVIYQKSSVSKTNGLSVFYPYASDKNSIKQTMALYQTFGFAPKYTSYLDEFVSQLLGESTTDWKITKNLPAPDTTTTDTSDFQFQLTAGQVKDYDKANYIVFRDMKDGYFMPMFKSSEVTIDGNGLLHANIKSEGLQVTSTDGSSGWLTMMEAERTKEYTYYLVSVITYNLFDENGDVLKVSDKKMQAAYLQVMVDAEHPEGQILGIVPQNDNIVAAKQLTNLDDWQYIQFLNFKYKILDSNGNYTTDWESSGEAYVYEMKTNELASLVFTDLEAEYDYYCVFMIKDLRGNMYYSGMIKMQ